MALGDHTPYIVGAAAAVLVLAALKRQATRSSLPLPPGPRPLPLLGNLFDFPMENAWLTYRDWNAQHGDVVYAEALGQKIVVLGSMNAVADLMERRSAKYSDRSSTNMLKLMDMTWMMTTLPYGETWRRERKLLHAYMHQGAGGAEQYLQLDAARSFARDILKVERTKEALPRAVRVSVGRSIIRMVYGIDAQDSDNEYVSLPEQVTEHIEQVGTPGRFLVDLFPILQHVPAWVPGAGFQRFAKRAQVDHRRMRDKPIEAIMAEMAKGSAPSSIACAMLEEDAALPVEESQLDMIKDVTGVAYLAGSDTTMATVFSFFLAMLVYPDVQAKAQAEVDRVTGKERLPEPTDAADMPYVQAVVSECLRWLPVVPMGVPHSTSEDDVYNGYLIPKGSFVFGNIWSILHNLNDYPEPESFTPERYLTPDGKLDPTVRDPRTACFGFGRRACPGRYVADASLFTMISTLLATVDIVRATDAKGHEIVPAVEVTSGLFSHAKPFAWDVRPRGQRAQEMIESALAH